MQRLQVRQPKRQWPGQCIWRGALARIIAASEWTQGGTTTCESKPRTFQGFHVIPMPVERPKPFEFYGFHVAIIESHVDCARQFRVERMVCWNRSRACAVARDNERRNVSFKIAASNQIPRRQITGFRCRRPARPITD